MWLHISSDPFKQGTFNLPPGKNTLATETGTEIPAGEKPECPFTINQQCPRVRNSVCYFIWFSRH